MTKITKQNMLNFIQGNARMIKANIGMGDDHIVEQVAYRKSKCPECEEIGYCQGPNCDCSVPGRWFSDRSCNLEKFPNIMGADEWEVYKKEHDIEIESNK